MCILLSQYLIEMTKIRLVLLAAPLLLLSSCFEITETYTLKENGAYTIEYSSDMSNMINIFQSLSENATVELNDFKAVDTTIFYTKILADSAKQKVDIEMQSLLSTTSLNLKMDVAKGTFLTQIKNHGTSTQELFNFLINSHNIINLGEEKIMNSFTPSNKDEDEYKSNNTLLRNNDFEYTITPTSFERKLTPEALEKYKDRDMANVNSFLATVEVDLNIMNTLTINLPRPIKSTGNRYATLSPDKKQFKLNVNLIKAAGNPDMLNFKIIY